MWQNLEVGYYVEDISLINGINALVDETLEAPLSFHHVRTQWEDSHVCAAGIEPSDTESVGAFIPGFPALEVWEILICCL